MFLGYIISMLRILLSLTHFMRGEKVIMVSLLYCPALNIYRVRLVERERVIKERVVTANELNASVYLSSAAQFCRDNPNTENIIVRDGLKASAAEGG